MPKKWFALLLGAAFFASVSLILAGEANVSADLPTFEILCADGSLVLCDASVTEREGVEVLTLAKEAIPQGAKSVELRHPLFAGDAKEPGFFVFSNGMYGEFRPGPDDEYRCADPRMPVFGVQTSAGAATVILTGMRYEADYSARRKSDQYQITPVWRLDGDPPYADIGLEIHPLPPEKANYSEMAKVYRKEQLRRGICRPLKERIQENPELAYAAGAMEVRVRMGWKPVPSTVGEQTAENEPPMKVAITFDRFAQIVDEFKRQGIDRAEFCLVGWNIGGHDGRYPQIFPPDERLGGEERLRAAIRHAQQEGYQIVCHTNNSDAYRASQIGGLWDEGFLLRKRDGSFQQYTTWGGGNMYETCPKCMFERFVVSDYAKLRDLGFRGLHYVDVFSTVKPRTCFAPEHPLTKEDFAHWTNEIFASAQQSFGGLGSEGGFDYCAAHLDYALYITFYQPGAKTHALVDRYVPFWHLVYNGIILNNPFTETTNYTIKPRSAALKMAEFGGRPMFYFYSKFRDSGSNWMGDADITCATDEELTASVRKIKEGYDAFEKLKHLQLEFMESHEKIADGVFQTVFSDGSAIVVNYGTEAFEYHGQTVPPADFLYIPHIPPEKKIP